VGNTRVWVEDWSLQLTPGGYVARVPARDFDIALTFKPTQGILLEGDRGFSRKGPKAAQASYYYSRPHLAVGGTIAVQGSTRQLQARRGSITNGRASTWRRELLVGLDRDQSR